MAPRRVIADSDDEDEADNPSSPLREDTELAGPPEVEPLSPRHRPSSDTRNQTSGTTDQSFFTSVYDEQQNRAVEQSQLIEQIVRQSQKASKSSGDVSLPAKGKGKKDNASSATSVTSPAILNKPGNQPSLFSDGASSITTPRKSAPGEWDVPSSAEGTSRSAKSSKGKNEKSYGKQRSKSKAIRSSAAAEIFMGNDIAVGEPIQSPAIGDEIPATNNGVEQSPQPTSKRRKLSLHDSVLQDTGATANFYVAQSNLTTMQKLEYQRVGLPQNSYSNHTGSLANQTPSSMTTIAYPTPSRYASSSVPLPWERGSMDLQADENSDTINMNSSPDVIAMGNSYTERETTEAPHIHTNEVSYESKIPTKDDAVKSPISKKRKSSPKNTYSEDELAQDTLEDIDTIDQRRDSPKRRRHDSQRSNSPNPLKNDEGFELVQNPYEEPPKGEAHGVDELAFEMPATEPPVPMSAPEPRPPETQPTPRPKKRGRKKKQPAAEQTIQGEQLVEDQTVVQEQDPITKDPETQAKPERTKKKRGRPRKSDQTIPDTVATPEAEHESLSVSNVHGDDSQRGGPAPEQAEVTKKPKSKKQARKKGERNEATNDTIPDGDEARDTSPLKELSTNARTSPQRSKSTEDVPAVSGAESSTDQNPPAKPQEKGSSTPKPTPTPTASQSKVPYRVGLSKRTRITSLLKSLKR